MLITVANGKGGVGKSTVALNLAVLMKAHQVIDVDSRNSVFKIHQLRDQYDGASTQLDVLSDPTPREIRDIIDSFDDHPERLYIADTGGINSEENQALFCHSDLIITPTEQGGNDKVGLDSFYNAIDHINFIREDKIECYVFLNKVHPSKIHLDSIKDFINKREYFNLMNSVIHLRKEVNESCTRCLSVSEYDEKCKAAKQFNELVSEINDILAEKGVRNAS